MFTSALPTIVVVLSQLAVATVIYRHTLQLGFLSDAWVYLWRLREGLWSMLLTPIGYHYQPVAYAWLALIRAVFGENAQAFQAVNIVQLVFLAYLTYELGRRLLPDAGLAFLASLLVLGNAAFYEASYWPLSGNAHTLAAELYVLAVILTYDVGCGRLSRTGPWLVGLTIAAAAFCHPATITSLPVCAVIFILTVRGTWTARSSWAWSTSRKLILAFGAVSLLFAISLFQFSALSEMRPQASFDPMRAYWLVTRGLVAVFSLRGSHDVVHLTMTFGAPAYISTGEVWVYVWAWLTVCAIAALLCFLRPSPLGLRVLVAFLWIHLVIAAIGSPFAPRQSQVPAVPAALITAWVLGAIAERLSRRTTSAAGSSVCRQLPAVGVLVLMVAARPDHQTAAELYLHASNSARALFNHVKAAGTQPVNITLVNMPSHTVARGIGAPTFSNGLEQLVRFTSVKFVRFEWCWISDRRSAAEFATSSIRITRDDLLGRLRDPSEVVLFYDRSLGVQPLTADRVEGLMSR